MVDGNKIDGRAGWREVMWEAGSITFGQFAVADQVMSLGNNLMALQDTGAITAKQAADWWQDLQARDKAGTFFASMTGVVAAGTVA